MSSFTADQQAFIADPGHCMAVAGPGSGKTTSLIEKICHLSALPGSRVVAATFTSDGASEMRHRLAKRLGASADKVRVNIGTWHMLCGQHRKAHGISSRTISPGHQAALLKGILTQHGLVGVELGEALITFDAIKCSLDQDFDTVPHEWFRAYQAELHHLDSIDLYDVVRDTALRMREQTLPLFDCTHLVVDESQDNDEVQFALANLHAAAGVVTTLVGDDDQAIYEWRRARGFTGMEAFANTHQARIITLGENFRSLRTIVEASDRLIQNNRGFRLEKNLISRRGAGGTVEVTSTASIQAASEMVIASIEPLLKEIARDGLERFAVPTGAVAVLARNNYMLDDAEAELLRAGIKYIRASGSIWSSEPASMLMTVLGTVVSDDIRGLHASLGLYGLPAGLTGQLSKDFKGRVHDFYGGRLDPEQYGTGGVHVRDVATLLGTIHALLEQRHYGAAINKAAALVRRAYSEPNLRHLRMSDQLSAAASGLISMRGPMPARFKQAQEAKEKQTFTNAVVLQTFHAAKGQEYRNVYLLGVDDDILPGKSDVRAERRLLYVAMTRAKDNLQVTHTSGKGSRFLGEFT